MQTNKLGTIMFILGLLLAFGGVGGIETSLNNLMLLGAFLVSLGGLLLMWVGVKLLQLTQEH